MRGLKVEYYFYESTFVKYFWQNIVCNYFCLNIQAIFIGKINSFYENFLNT